MEIHENDINVSERLLSICQFLRTQPFQSGSISAIPGMEGLPEHLKFNYREILVIALLYGFQCGDIPATSTRILLLSRSWFSNEGELQEILMQLKKLGLIGREESKQGYVYYLIHRYFFWLRQNRYELVAQLKPVGLERMLLYFHSKILRNNFFSFSDLEYELEYLASINPDVNLVKQGFRVLKQIDTFIICAACTYKYIFDEPFSTAFLRINYENDINTRTVIHEIVTGNLLAMKAGHLRIAGGELTGEEPLIELTEKGEDLFLHELESGKRTQQLCLDIQLPSHAILPESIQPVKLLFDPAIEKQVKDLQTLVMPKFYSHYIEKLKPSARMRGVTVLLHGAPGTGKTELALQLARKSKRPLFRIDVSQIMSKWVGESEKNLRSRFREYRRFVIRSKTEPILFLNECDQLLGRRISVSQSVDQMRNSLQNMLLEEMESFQGILLATTNMTMNLDDAFERRFLYKVRFNPPDPGMVALHWKNAFPRLSPQQCKWLAGQFPFSPGEMQNIAAKLLLRRQLNPKTKYFDTVVELCREEKWDEQLQLMGFKLN